MAESFARKSANLGRKRQRSAYCREKQVYLAYKIIIKLPFSESFDFSAIQEFQERYRIFTKV